VAVVATFVDIDIAIDAAPMLQVPARDEVVKRSNDTEPPVVRVRRRREDQNFGGRKA
jgi:hypothetical protein